MSRLNSNFVKQVFRSTEFYIESSVKRQGQSLFLFYHLKTITSAFISSLSTSFLESCLYSPCFSLLFEPCILLSCHFNLLAYMLWVAFLPVSLSRPMIVRSVYTLRRRCSDQWRGSVIFNGVAVYLFPCNNFVSSGSESGVYPCVLICI